MENLKIENDFFPIRAYGRNKQIRISKDIPAFSLGKISGLTSDGVIYKDQKFIKYDDLLPADYDAMVWYFKSFQKYCDDLQIIFDDMKAAYIKGAKIYMYADSLKYMEASVVFETRVGISYKTANKFIHKTLRGLGYKTLTKSDLGVMYVAKMHQDFADLPIHKRILHNLTRIF